MLKLQESTVVHRGFSMLQLLQEYDVPTIYLLINADCFRDISNKLIIITLYCLARLNNSLTSFVDAKSCICAISAVALYVRIAFLKFDDSSSLSSAQHYTLLV